MNLCDREADSSKDYGTKLPLLCAWGFVVASGDASQLLQHLLDSKVEWNLDKHAA